MTRIRLRSDVGDSGGAPRSLDNTRKWLPSVDSSLNYTGPMK